MIITLCTTNIFHIFLVPSLFRVGATPVLHSIPCTSVRKTALMAGPGIVSRRISRPKRILLSSYRPSYYETALSRRIFTTRKLFKPPVVNQSLETVITFLPAPPPPYDKPDRPTTPLPPRNGHLPAVSDHYPRPIPSRPK